MSPAVAPGWRLAFDLRGGGAEPSFASARPDARRELYGALYDLTPSDWARVCVGGRPVRLRRRAPSAVKRLDGEIEWAYTLAAAPGPMRIANEADEPVPSERYPRYLRKERDCLACPTPGAATSTNVARSRSTAAHPGGGYGVGEGQKVPVFVKILLMARSMGEGTKGEGTKGRWTCVQRPASSNPAAVARFDGVGGATAASGIMPAQADWPDDPLASNSVGVWCVGIAR